MPQFTTPDGLSLHYTDTGRGLPLLCLAGLTRDGRDFDYLAPHLTDLRMITLDSRGRGRSQHAAPDSYTVPIEARDALALLDHLGIEKAAILGTSRGGLIAMLIAAMAKDRLIGVALNDIGPEIDPRGLAVIRDYIGRPPAARTLDEAATSRAAAMSAFVDVPFARWRDEVAKFYTETPEGLRLSYDPALREAVLAQNAEPTPDLWPLFDALAGLPLCTLRADGSDILSAETLAAMQQRRPDMIAATIPGRGHVPFLDEPDALAALHRWRAMLA